MHTTFQVVGTPNLPPGGKVFATPVPGVLHHLYQVVGPPGPRAQVPGPKGQALPALRAGSIIDNCIFSIVIDFNIGRNNIRIICFNINITHINIISINIILYNIGSNIIRINNIDINIITNNISDDIINFNIINNISITDNIIVNNIINTKNSINFTSNNKIITTDNNYPGPTGQGPWPSCYAAGPGSCKAAAVVLSPLVTLLLRSSCTT